MLSWIALDLQDIEAARAWAAEAWRRKPASMHSCGAKLALELQVGSLALEAGCEEALLESVYYESVFRDRYLAIDQAEQARAHYAERVPGIFDQGRPFQAMDYRHAIDLYPVLLRTGERELADALLDKAEAFVRGHFRLSTGGYGWADVEIYALRGETDKALAAMRSAIDEGLRWEWNLLPYKLNLQSLWDEPEFKAMLGELEVDMAIRREAVRVEFGTLYPPGASG